MKISYDAEADVLSILFHETTVTTQDLADGITAEYDADGRLAGLEILDASHRLRGAEPFRQIVLEGVGIPAAV